MAGERIKKESSKAYYCFKKYFEYGPMRSIRKLSKQLQEEGEIKVHTVTLERYSKKYDWQSRIREWEFYNNKIERQTQDDELKNMIKRHTQESMMLQQKSIEKLKDILPDALSNKEALDMLKEGVRLERISRGEPETRIEETSTAKLIDHLKRWFDDDDETALLNENNPNKEQE